MQNAPTNGTALVQQKPIHTIGRLPNATECDALNADTVAASLTPQQCEAAVLLLSGNNIQQVALTLGVHRSTLWKWRALPTFKAYYNTLLQEIRQNTQEAIVSLCTDAIATLQRVMNSDNEAVALKAAICVLERAEGLPIGKTDAREMVRDECTTDEVGEMLEGLKMFDRARYEKRCRELGIEP